MSRSSLPFASTLLLALVAVVSWSGVGRAQDAGVLGACAPGKAEIRADQLPQVVDRDRCPLEGRVISDGSTAAVVPPAGEGVHVEVLTARGAQELEIRHLRDGSIELDHVGDESGGAESLAGPGRPEVSAGAAAPGQCRDTAYRDSGYRVVEGLRYRINTKTIPGEIPRGATVAAIRRAGGNVSRTDNECGMGDRVPASASYRGSTSRFPNPKDGSCAASDGVSVIAFGDLPSALATTCTYFDLKAGPDEVTSSDTKLNKAGFRWTTSPRSRSCRARHDVQAVMTHEWGHAFGLGHVPPREHANLTMAPFVGPCQASERTLGRGDVLGLASKYTGGT